jgi:hypothetical protein
MHIIQVTLNSGTVTFVDSDLNLSRREYAHTFSSYAQALSARKHISNKFTGSTRILDV